MLKNFSFVLRTNEFAIGLIFHDLRRRTEPLTQNFSIIFLFSFLNITFTKSTRNRFVNSKKRFPCGKCCEYEWRKSPTLQNSICFFFVFLHFIAAVSCVKMRRARQRERALSLFIYINVKKLNEKDQMEL